MDVDVPVSVESTATKSTAAAGASDSENEGEGEDEEDQEDQYDGVAGAGAASSGTGAGAGEAIAAGGRHAARDSRGPLRERFRRMSAALCEVVDDYGLVSFHPMNVEDAEVRQGKSRFCDVVPPGAAKSCVALLCSAPDTVNYSSFS